MKHWKLIVLVSTFFPLMAVQAEETQSSAPQTPHQLTHSDAEPSLPPEEAHRVTIAQAGRLADGTSVQIQGRLEKKQGEDVYLLRDDSGQIDAVIPAAVLRNAAVAPGDNVSVLGALDKKQTPYRLRVSHFEKR
ncbi:NirD/YgiW/YdeI family stress tolerance protein [Enterobacteriaceae bacterium 4M9]|nr:NirD/YgiW/YdeI family stress tolerance protein [Enterobacteriaceae bacterium 4M9]